MLKRPFFTFINSESIARPCALKAVTIHQEGIVTLYTDGQSTRLSSKNSADTQWVSFNVYNRYTSLKDTLRHFGSHATVEESSSSHMHFKLLSPPLTTRSIASLFDKLNVWSVNSQSTKCRRNFLEKKTIQDILEQYTKFQTCSLDERAGTNYITVNKAFPPQARKNVTLTTHLFCHLLNEQKKSLDYATCVNLNRNSSGLFRFSPKYSRQQSSLPILGLLLVLCASILFLLRSCQRVNVQRAQPQKQQPRVAAPAPG